MASVEIQSISKSFGSSEVIHGVDVEIEDGEFVVLVGPSGCGKSTLLRMIAGLEGITEGRISIGGRVVNHLPPSQRDIAMVFQNYALYPHKTVASNMALALRMQRVEKAEIKRRVEQASEILGLTPYLDRYPRALSGGQRQRVAMGRAIVRDPQVFLFDEPLSNLDAKLRVQMRAEIRKLHQRLQTTTVYVTHDQIEAMTMADRIVVMQSGYIEQTGTPLEVYDKPRNTFVAGFIGSPSMNMLDAVIRSGNGKLRAELGNGSGLVSLPLGDRTELPDGQEVTIGIRPEHLVPGQDGMVGEVAVVEPTGSETHIVARALGRDVTAVLRERLDVRPGEEIRLRAESSDIHLFDRKGGERLG